MRILPTLGSVLLLLTSCQIGTHARNYQPARGPAGAALELELNDKSKLTGELLAVEEGALLVLRGRELVRVDLPQIREGHAPKVSFRGTKLDSATRERLRLISRYPQGVSSDLETRLLQAFGQSSMMRIP